MYILVAYQKQVIENRYDIHQGVKALKSIVKNIAWWPLMDNYNELLLKKCTVCSRHRPRLNDSTDKWEECGPWERLHMEWLYKHKYGNVLVTADAGSGCLEALPCTDRSRKDVVTCLRTIISRSGIPYTIVSGNGKELFSKDLKE